MAQSPLTPAEFATALDVSRETLARLQLYLDLLVHWQRRINLIGPATLADPWRRHLLDCGQILRLIPRDTDDLLDFGSGAGLPGLVLAIMGVRGVQLVESDRRKAQFLREAARATAAAVTVHACRIEALPRRHVAVITARALAPLPRLLNLAAGFIGPDTLCVFPKGRSAEQELTQACKFWNMTVQTVPSLSEPSSLLLQLRSVERASDRQS